MTASGFTLYSALNLAPGDCLALVGAGGKTSALAQLARQKTCPVILACSTHFGAWQTAIAGRHVIIDQPSQLAHITDLPDPVTLFTGPAAGDNRLSGLSLDALAVLRDLAVRKSALLVIEADGSRRRPLKAPAVHEPVIPSWINHVVVVAGLSGLGQPVDEAHQAVFRPAVFAQLAGVEPGSPVAVVDLMRVLCHPQGGLKEIPAAARRTVLLNQADTPSLRAEARQLAGSLLTDYDQVLTTSLQSGFIWSADCAAAGIILAGADSLDRGQSQEPVLWRGQPLMRSMAENALKAGLNPLIVVSDALDEPIRADLAELPVHFVHDPSRQAGQSSSLQAGLQTALRLRSPRALGAAVIFDAGRPFLSPALINTMLDLHRTSLPPAIVPVIAGQPTAPVLFDQVTFASFEKLAGSQDINTVLSHFVPARLLWEDTALL